MDVVLILLAMGAIAAIELPLLIREKQRPALVGFLVTWSLATLFALAYVLNLGIPNPTDLIMELMTP